MAGAVPAHRRHLSHMEATESDEGSTPILFTSGLRRLVIGVV
jgi:hypothetical protein